MSRRAASVVVLAALAGSVVPATAMGARDGGSPVTGSTVAHSGAAAPKGAKGAPPLYTARISLCHRGNPIDVRGTFLTTTIRPLAAATRMAVKVEFYERALPAGHWTLREDVPGMGTWISPSDPSLGSRPDDVWRYRQAVTRLHVPFAYRFHVGFRWLDDEGTVVREEAVTTRPCRQPDLRPDLTIAEVSPIGLARQPGRVRYRVTIRNDGRSLARGVEVAATLPGDTVVGSHVVKARRVDPGDAVDVAFTGPGCEAGTAPVPSFTVDPANAIEEHDEADNAFALVCPVP